MKEGGCDVVELEGGREIVEIAIGSKKFMGEVKEGMFSEEGYVFRGVREDKLDSLY